MRDRAAELADRIRHWDREDVYELLSMVRELDSIAAGHFPKERFVDLSSLPTVPIPDLETGCVPYPVWAMDIHERCLVGDRELFVETLEDILYRHRSGKACGE